jgi:hypothetical protein
VTGIPQELFRESIESMLTGDIATAKIILRDYINATVGFSLAEATHIPCSATKECVSKLRRRLGKSS